MNCIALGILVGTLLIANTAGADPERSYQGGKALTNAVTGNKQKVDDRDVEQRASDWLKAKGAEHGKALKKSSEESKSKK